MLTTCTIIMMLLVAYAYFREGALTAFSMFVNVCLAGVVTFNFWEPLADWLDPLVAGSFLAGFEDFLVMVLLFSVTLGLLRLLTNNLQYVQVEYHPAVGQGGGVVFGLLTGYLVAGFLVSALETLPWHENFMYFEPRVDAESGFRSFLPPDRVWLALMRRAGAYPLANRAMEEESEEPESNYDRFQTFDREPTFELRYWRYRRYGDTREKLPYQGELDKQLGRSSQ
jgi:colicin V production protein